MAFMSVDKDKVIQDNIDKAEKELNEALENERPDELGANAQKAEDKAAGKDDEIPAVIDGHDWKQRYGNLQKYIEKTLKPKFKADIDALTVQVKDLTTKFEAANKAVTATAQLPESVEEVDLLKRENPGAYNAILAIAEQIAERTVEKKTAHLNERYKEIESSQQRNSEEAMFLQLQKKHPDLDIRSLETDEVFMEWLFSKSKRTQDALIGQKEDVEAASEVLDLYKLENGIKKPKAKAKEAGDREQRKDAMRDVSTSTAINLPAPDAGYDFTESQIDEMDKRDNRWFDRNAEAIEAAMKKGRVLMDMTDPMGAQRRLASRAA